MSASETSFDNLSGVPVHYDRLPPKFPYGSQGTPRDFQCRNKLKDTLNACFEDLFSVWRRGKPTIILSAGTIGDGKSAHGQGFAFDLDGFHWESKIFMMNQYKTDRQFYIGINAHLFLYFSQVLSYHYPNHQDHFHVDFNFALKFRPESNAQTFFLQSALKYVFERNIGKTGSEKDGVDGVYGGETTPVISDVLSDLGLAGRGGLTVPTVWKEFLLACRSKSFE